MSTRSIAVVVLAVLCGLSAAVGMSRLRQSGQTAPEVETSPVVLAAVDIPRGKMVAAGDLEVRQWPNPMLPKGAMGTIEAAANRTAAGPILAGEPILESKLAAKGSRGGMAWLIPQGMRAYTIQASRANSSVAGFILPGNKVDVLLNLRSNANDDNGGGRTIALLQAVEILAVDQNLDAPVDNKTNPKDLSSVTLLVTPEQASKLDLGQNQGQLSLSLRNPEDGVAGPTNSVTVTNILPERPIPKPGPSSAAAPRPVEDVIRYEIVTLRGTHRGAVVLLKRP